MHIVPFSLHLANENYMASHITQTQYLHGYNSSASTAYLLNNWSIKQGCTYKITLTDNMFLKKHPLRRQLKSYWSVSCSRRMCKHRYGAQKIWKPWLIKLVSTMYKVNPSWKESWTTNVNITINQKFESKKCF